MFRLFRIKCGVSKVSYQLSDTSTARLFGVDPRLVEIIDRALTISLIDFGVASGRRSAQEQNELYISGASNCDGYKVLSKHQFGRAVDLYAYQQKALWTKADLALVACAMLESAAALGVPLQWGGKWRSFPDYPHFEIAEDK